ncbi:hypothetical protein SCLCIDRAFT_654261 [Scleroderma citrinum Foug A]|uniref:Uncharacterized protein n=1 Tax=Scleroderma citrinum Foug A TaxID=1036808 RepID=A0A0C2ZEA8_9AGAM|nr:hypothetical protein SCLCIDRAFT_654261 [Scleroderma citrinum Foug A]
MHFIAVISALPTSCHPAHHRGHTTLVHPPVQKHPSCVWPRHQIRLRIVNHMNSYQKATHMITFKTWMKNSITFNDQD